MNMNPEQQNFDHLRRLLRLKRYEHPHPRYFNDFSSRVISRIRAGEEGGEAALGHPSWLLKFWSLFEAKPMLPGAIGVALCALLVFVAVGTGKPDDPSGSIVTATQPAPLAPASIFADQVENRAAVFNSTNPVIQLRGGSLFDQIRLPQTELVTRPFGNN